MLTRPITFLSDYGYEDEFAGVCRAVIAAIAPQAGVIDVGHGIPPHDVRRGAVGLADAIPYLPAGVHLAVVDPGVGTARRPVAVRAGKDDRVLVGPDNGLLWPAIEALGGTVEAVDLTGSPFRLESDATTFDGRDVFAPVAARLALGASLRDAGSTLDPASLTRLSLPAAWVEDGRVHAEVLYGDRFGNLTLAARPGEVAETLPAIGGAVVIEAPSGSHGVRFARSFAQVGEGELALYEDSSGRLALAVNRGSAGEVLAIAPGDEIVLRAAT